jgi:small-conductance mechanosensitive channel
MNAELASLAEQLLSLWTRALSEARLMLLPSRLYQIGILFLCIFLAWALNRWINPRIREWMRGLEGRPKWQLRTLLVLHRRLGLMIFTFLIWIFVWVIAEITPFFSRRFLLELVGTIALAVVLVGLAARLIRNQLLRRIVTWSLWIYVTLYYIGLADELTRFLDALAIDIGEFHLSLFGVLQALIVIGALFTLARLVTHSAALRIQSNENISPSMQVLTVKFLQVLLFGAAFFIGLKVVGVDLTGLAVLSGAIGVGLGFGLQKVVSNLV